MTRDEAIRLMAFYEAASASLGPVFSRSRLSDDAEQKRVTAIHGRLIMYIYEECMRPIIALYPDLDPDFGRLAENNA